MVALEDPQGAMIPHPVTTRRGSVTNARNLDISFKIVLSGKRNQRRRNTRITVLMMQKKEEIHKILIIKILKAFISQEEQVQEGQGIHWQGNGL